MRARDLIAASRCASCGRKIMEAGLPLFWRVTIERHGIDMRAVQRVQGMITYLGGSLDLAEATGTDEDLTKPMMDPVTITLCEPCGTGESISIAGLGLREPSGA